MTRRIAGRIAAAFGRGMDRHPIVAVALVLVLSAAAAAFTGIATARLSPQVSVYGWR